MDHVEPQPGPDARTLMDAADALDTTGAETRRMVRILLAKESQDDRDGFVAFVVGVQELADPGSPEELEAAARSVLASIRGLALSHPAAAGGRPRE